MSFTNCVLSGVQPTGALHLGNYLGAIKNFVALQSDYEQSLYCVVDQHAITVSQNPEELRKNVRSVAAAYLAAGIDPKQSAIFNQSAVSAHTQLAWVLNCVARLGWLNRMTQFKEKAGKNKENASIGLYTYPILMAADILCYKATHVPVGADQKQHLELARDIATRFNLEHAGYDFFPLPEPLIGETAMRIMSLRDGTKKMSKSDPSDYARIHLTDSDEDIIKKFKKAKTDGGEMPATIEELEERPEIKNLLTLHAAMTNGTLAKSLTEFKSQNFSTLKSTLADITIEVVRPFRIEMTKVLEDTDYIDTILQEGAMKARAIASPIVKDVYDIMGFLAFK
ncbi:MAG: tryptophan--tRNA ligase [Pseudomonadota bacterium]